MRLLVNLILVCALASLLVSCRLVGPQKKQTPPPPPPVVEPEPPPAPPVLTVTSVSVETNSHGLPASRLSSRTILKRLALTPAADRATCVFEFPDNTTVLPRLQCYGGFQLLVSVYRPENAAAPGMLGFSLELLDGVRKSLTPLIPADEFPLMASAAVDSGEVFFCSAKTGRLDLWRRLPKTSRPNEPQLQLFSTDNLANVDPAVSPSGRMVLFTAYDPRQPSARKLWLLNTDRYASKKPTFLCDGRNGAWSPDSRQIAYADPAGTAIWVIDADASHNHRITPPDASWIERDPVWSADGQRLIFVSNRNSVDPDCFHLWLCDADGKNARQLTSGPVLDDAPVVSPTGLIYFRTHRQGRWAIYTLKLPPAASSGL